jgi:ATP adenylyltransferase
MSSDKRPIWAPWRIDFIRSEKTSECFLCNNKEYNKDSSEEELIILRKEQTFAILNRYPYNPGHILISPYRHIGDLGDMTESERSEMMETVLEVQELLKKVMNPNGFNIGLNLGVDAGAGVADHIHMHIIPRWRGDNNFMPVITDKRVVPEALNETAKLLRETLNK